MDTNIKIMVSLGASYAAGCIPCFDHYFMLAKEEKISEDDIKQIIAIAKKVRNGSDIAMERAICEVMNGNQAGVKFDDESHPCKCC